MAANPPLTQLADGTLAPTVDTAEALVLARGGVRFTIDNVRTPSKKWASVPGTLYLTTTRLVFIAAAADPSGLVAFALPLTALSPDTDFVQPIFAANHLRGRVSATGPGGEAHAFKLEFKEGGVGTFLPLYFNLLELNRALAARGGGGGGGGEGGNGAAGGSGGGEAAAADAAAKPFAAAAPAPPPKPDVATAFVDPSDPTKLFLTEPATKQ